MHLLRKRTVGHLALLMATVLFVVACGAAAPVATPTPPPPPPPPPPPAAFAVTTTVPVAGATNVPLTSAIVINFSAAVQNASWPTPGSGGNPCTLGNILIAPAPVAPWGCAITAAAQVTLGPIVPGPWLAGQTMYTVTVLQQVSSLAGVALAASYTFTFTTRVSAVRVDLTATIAPGYVASPNAAPTAAAIGAGLWVGDCETALAGSPCAAIWPLGLGDIAERAFVAFPLGPLFAAVGSATPTIEEAELTIPSSLPVTDFPNPLDMFGPLGGPILVERVDYLNNGVLDWPGDYAMAATGGAIRTIDQLAITTWTGSISALVQSAITLPAIAGPPVGGTYLGLRFRWGVSGTAFFGTPVDTNNDATSDQLLLGSPWLRIWARTP